MILRFRKDSEAEKTAKELVENIKSTNEYAKNIIEEITGVRPLGFGYRWYFDISYNWDCFNTGFGSNAPEEIKGMKLLRDHNGIRYYSPNKRTKEGKQMITRFNKEQCRIRTSSGPLNKFGIYTEHGSEYTQFQLGQDKDGVYMAISASAFGWLTPHPDVFLETPIQTVSK